MSLKTPPEEEPDAEEQEDELDEALTGMDYIPYTPAERGGSSSHRSSSGTTRMSTLAASKH